MEAILNLFNKTEYKPQNNYINLKSFLNMDAGDCTTQCNCECIGNFCDNCMPNDCSTNCECDRD